MNQRGLRTPECRRLDMSSYARRAHFDYFRAMPNPYVGTTCQVDVTRFMQKIKAEKQPFFLSFLWYAAKAANAVPELRRRIDGEGIVEFSSCCTSHTEAKPDGSYAYCSLDCSLPLQAFLPYARERQAQARALGTIDEDGAESLSLFFVSCVPWFSYTALTQPVPSPADSNPRITWGKYETQGERVSLPLSILCNHALVDGMHIARFYEALRTFLEEIEP